MIQNREEFLKNYLSIEDREKRKSYLRIRKYQATHQESRLLHSSKARAKKAGIEHTLVIEDIVIPKYCPFLHIPITNIYGAGRVYSNASLDRVNPAQGYHKDNIQVISDLANRMKQDATVEQLQEFAQGVFDIYGYPKRD